ncbi:hypothetical protein GCM10009801_19740 [Streptomyces albiaxialis]|uniref:Uncharacterized protein n=1 Tax=Streptomyces albiaxialis TaxID=329523 RepID=A0ABN2VRZ0_9ACTN
MYAERPACRAYAAWRGRPIGMSLTCKRRPDRRAYGPVAGRRPAAAGLARGSGRRQYAIRMPFVDPDKEYV